jgi:hypothetical protein
MTYTHKQRRDESDVGKTVYGTEEPAEPEGMKAGCEGEGKGEGKGEAGRLDGSEPEYGFDWTRNELLSRGIAGRGAASTGSRNPGGLKSGSRRAGCCCWGRAGGAVTAVTRLRCWKAGKSVVKK